MFAKGSQRCCCCSSHSFQTRPRPLPLIHTRTQAGRVGQKHRILPRPPYDRAISSNSTTGPASSVLAVRHILKSRGRNLRLSRSSSLLTPTSITSTSRFSPLYTPRNRDFSSTPFAMTATKIDGTAIAKGIRERLHAEIEATQKANPRYKPSLKIIQGIYCTVSTFLTCTDPQFSGRTIRFEFVFLLNPDFI
jgi:hypothetical protein